MVWSFVRAAMVSAACLLCADAPATAPVRLLADAPSSAALGSPSPDGKYLSLVDGGSGDLSLRELASGRTLRLTRNGTAELGQFAYFSAFSGDSRHIAYA